MDAMLQALGGILLKAIPTFLLVVLLHFYLKGVFFNPMRKVLRQRYDATEGARKLAAESLERAAAKTAEYAAAMRAARTEIYQAQEQAHKRLQESEMAKLAAARRHAEAAVAEAKSRLAGDVQAAKAALARDSELLANQIADSILRGRAA
jgi:F-type H+-transporting ATPase subunit b